jgi:Lar family restriction alleviation protein
MKVEGVKLSPCPFCANRTHRRSDDERFEATGAISIRCRDCGATGPTAGHIQAAANLWNRREKCVNTGLTAQSKSRRVGSA